MAMIALQSWTQTTGGAARVTVLSIEGESRTRTLPCSYEKFTEGMKAYQGGALIQNALPFLSPADREFLMTGMTDEEWEKMCLEDRANHSTEESGNPLGWECDRCGREWIASRTGALTAGPTSDFSHRAALHYAIAFCNARRGRPSYLQAGATVSSWHESCR